MGIVRGQSGEVALLERWFSTGRDVRHDPTINRKIAAFVEQHHVKSVGVSDGIIGCPHEEGKEYPLGESCPQCPYWANRDRWTGDLLEEAQETPTVRTVIGCAWYRADQWERLREISADPDKLEETHEEWVTTAKRSLREMKKAGILAEKVDVDVEELLAWCREHGEDVDGGARASYAAEMLRQRHEREGPGGD